jgi:hypothetical protein
MCPLLWVEKEMILPTKSDVATPNTAAGRSDASSRKEERAKDGAQAMMEYLANARMVRERTAQLRALRLAREAAEKQANGSVKVVPTKRSKSKAKA